MFGNLGSRICIDAELDPTPHRSLGSPRCGADRRAVCPCNPATENAPRSPTHALCSHEDHNAAYGPRA